MMNLHPFYECATKAQIHIMHGGEIYQQWLCEHCGVKQTMPDANKFYTKGECEECKKITDIEKNGCNYMLIKGFNR